MRTISLDGQTALPDLEYCYDGIIEQCRNEHRVLTLSLIRAQVRQESMFNPIAQSPTGPIGLGQFTLATWNDIHPGKRRTDILHAISGLVLYMNKMLVWTISHRIPDKERLRFALAAYNQGMGNVFKAMNLTEEMGGDPKRWNEVVELMDRVVGNDRAREVKNYVNHILRRRDIYDEKEP